MTGGAAPSPTAAGPTGTRSLVWGFALTETVSWGILFYALPVLLVPMQDDLGWSRSTIVGAFSLAIVLSGLAAPVVGRRLDRADPRWLITGGSVLGTLLVVAWSQVTTPVTYYVVWIGIGLVKAVVLYEAAFTVLIKRCAPHHQRAVLIVTLTAALASTIFQPLTSALATATDWRTALLILAGILGVVTVPVHWVVLRPGPTAQVQPRTAHPAAGRSWRQLPELAERRFWALTAAFTSSAVTTFAMAVLLVAYLTDRGWSLAAAATATGTIGLMQLPGRLAFGPLSRRFSPPVLAPLLFTLPGVGVLLLLIGGAGVLVWPAVTLLGLGQGSSILLRAVLFVQLYGTERIGVLNGVNAVPVTVARALAPFAATLLVALTGGFAAVLVVLAGFSGAAAVLARRALAGVERTGSSSGPAAAVG